MGGYPKSAISHLSLSAQACQDWGGGEGSCQGREGEEDVKGGEGEEDHVKGGEGRGGSAMY